MCYVFYISSILVEFSFFQLLMNSDLHQIEGSRLHLSLSLSLSFSLSLSLSLFWFDTLYNNIELHNV